MNSSDTLETIESVGEGKEQAVTSASKNEIEFRDYMNESQLDHVMQLVTQDLSEPYSSKFISTLIIRIRISVTHTFLLALQYSLHLSILSIKVSRIMYTCCRF